MNYDDKNCINIFCDKKCIKKCSYRNNVSKKNFKEWENMQREEYYK